MLKQLVSYADAHPQWKANAALLREALKDGYWPTYGEIPFPSPFVQDFVTLPTAKANTDTKMTRLYVVKFGQWDKVGKFEKETLEFTFDNWPCDRKFRISQLYGNNPEYYSQFPKKGYPKLTGHEGLDIAVYEGSPLYAVADGVITRVEHNPTKSAYGYHVRIDHENGYKTTYGHMNNNFKVNKGDRVSSGQTIGYVGRSGNIKGIHLHFNVKLFDATRVGLVTMPYDLIDPLWVLPK